MKRTRHGTTIVAVRIGKVFALAADQMEIMDDHYPASTSCQKIFKLLPDVYVAYTGWSDAANGLHTLLKEAFATRASLAKGKQPSWVTVMKSFWTTLREWTGLLDDFRKGIAEHLLYYDEWALGLIISKRGIYFVTSQGNFGRLSRNVYGDGCGGMFAEGAARALLRTGGKDVEKIAREAVKVAAKSTVFANARVTSVVVRV